MQLFFKKCVCIKLEDRKSYMKSRYRTAKTDRLSNRKYKKINERSEKITKSQELRVTIVTVHEGKKIEKVGLER